MNERVRKQRPFRVIDPLASGIDMMTMEDDPEIPEEEEDEEENERAADELQLLLDEQNQASAERRQAVFGVIGVANTPNVPAGEPQVVSGVEGIAAADNSVKTGPHPFDTWRWEEDGSTERMSKRYRSSELAERDARLNAFQSLESDWDGSGSGRAEEGESAGGEVDDEDDESQEGGNSSSSSSSSSFCYLCETERSVNNIYQSRLLSILREATRRNLRMVCVRASSFYSMVLRVNQPGQPEWSPQAILQHITMHEPSTLISLHEDYTVLNHLFDAYRRNMHVTDSVTGSVRPPQKDVVNGLMMVIRQRQKTRALMDAAGRTLLQ